MKPTEGGPQRLRTPMSLLDTTQIALEDAMRGSMLRQTLLTNNLANVDTPGYQRQDVDFQSTLRAAMQDGQPLDQVNFTPVTQQQATRADGNGVNAEQESAYVAENGLLYQELTQIAATREQILQSAMGTR
jgi:flagellar basal-body rod protein FlgB